MDRDLLQEPCLCFAKELAKVEILTPLEKWNRLVSIHIHHDPIIYLPMWFVVQSCQVIGINMGEYEQKYWKLTLDASQSGSKSTDYPHLL